MHAGVLRVERAWKLLVLARTFARLTSTWLAPHTSRDCGRTKLSRTRLQSWSNGLNRGELGVPTTCNQTRQASEALRDARDARINGAKTVEFCG